MQCACGRIIRTINRDQQGTKTLDHMAHAPFFSIIVPVYNQQQGISKTLQSLVGQTFNNLEIIIVNDGSTDDSLAICEAFASTDPRIRIVNKPNEGLPFARKSGLETAKGEYIHNLDGGDYVEHDAYECLSKAIIEGGNPDILVFRFKYVTTSGKDLPSKPYPATIRTTEDMMRHILTTMQYNSVWQYVYRRGLSDSIAFCKDLTLKEDLYYTIQLLNAADSLSIINDVLYCYVVDDASMANSKFTLRSLESLEKADALVEEFLRKNNMEQSFDYEILAMRLQSYALAVLGGLTWLIKDKKPEFDKAFKKYPCLKKTGEIRRIYKLLKAQEIGLLSPMIAYYKMKGKIRQ